MGKVFKTIMRYMFSHVGLCFLLGGYCALGALLFEFVEGDPELERLKIGKQMAIDIEKERGYVTGNISILRACFIKEHLAMVDMMEANSGVEKSLIIKYMALQRCRNDQVLRKIKRFLNRYQRKIETAINGYKYDGTIHETLFFEWTYASSLVFTVSIITLIGYGHVAPKTEVGRFLVIPYSLLGIPLTLMFLANIGKLFATAIRLSYARGCCYLCYKKRERTQLMYEEDDRGYLIRRIQPYPPVDGQQGLGPIPVQPNPTGLGPELMVDDLEEGGYRPESRNLSEFEEEVWEEEPTNEIATVPVPIALTCGIILLYVFLGALMFKFLEDWSLITSSYFSFVTLTTIGFGDYVPGFDAADTFGGKMKLMVASVYIVVGLAVLSMGFDLIVLEIFTKAKQVAKVTGIIEIEDKARVDEEQLLSKKRKKKEGLEPPENLHRRQGLRVMDTDEFEKARFAGLGT